MSLEMVTDADSWVALAAVDSAVYQVQEKVKRPMQRVKSTCVATVGWASVAQRFTRCGLLGQVAREELGGPACCSTLDMEFLIKKKSLYICP